MLQLHPCKIARRGKAAKGTVEVQTFGKPVTGEDGVTREWDYTEYADTEKYPLEELIVYLQEFGLNNLVLIQAIDNLNKSETMKSQNESVLLAAQIVAEDLLLKDEDADDIAKALIRARKDQIISFGDAAMSIERMMELRRRMVDKERKKAGMLPRLIKKSTVNAADLTDSE